MRLKLKLTKDSTSGFLILATLLVNISQNLFFHFLWLGILFIGALYVRKGNLKKDWFVYCAVAFEVFLFASYVWAIKTPLTSTGARSILIEYSTILLSIFIISYRSSDSDFTQRLIRIINFSTLIYCAYVFIETPLSDWGRVYIGDTIGIGKNAVGMRCAWGILFAFYLVKSSKKKLFYIASMGVFGLFVAFSGSRKAILIAVMGIALFQLFCGGTKKLPRNILIGVIVVSVSLYFLYNNALLYEMVGNRLESTIDAIFRGGSGDGSMQERSYYKLQAIRMFSDRPLLGYGINGFMVHMQQIGYWHVAYSHCNYTELLANYGIFGFVLFYIPRFYLMIKTFIQKIYKKNTMFSMFFAAIIIELIMDYEMVSYYNISSQLIFCIAAPILVRELKNNKAENRRMNNYNVD